MICLDKAASWVFQLCGHKCLCKGCVRKQKEKMLKPKSSGNNKGGKRRHPTPLVTCPMCRAVTQVVPSSRFDGTVFE